MEAELRADRSLGDFAGLERGEGGAEGRHVGARHDPAEKPALSLVARVFGEFRRELAEVRTLVDAVDEVLRLIFRLHEDVADLIFRVAVGLLVGVVGLLEIRVGNRVLLHPVLSETLNEDAVAGRFDRALHFGKIGDLRLLGLLQKHRFVDEDVLHLAFKVGARRLALRDRLVVNGLLFGNGDRLAVHLEGLELGRSRTGREGGGDAEDHCVLVHVFFILQQ